MKEGASEKGRKGIASASGIDRAMILAWVNRADLFRIKGVGCQYSDVLEKAGVDAVVELSKRGPATFIKRWSKSTRPKTWSMACRALKRWRTGSNRPKNSNGVHPNQLYKWKAQAVENLSGLFEDDRKSEKSLKAEHERQLKELYAEMGKLTTQLAWLKKIWHRTSCGVSGWRCSNGNQLNCRS